MQRSEIHLQIAEVSEKIMALNRHLSQSSKLLKAETDLMQVYLHELRQLFAQLENAVAATVNKPQGDIIINVEKQEVIIPEVKPEKKQPAETKKETVTKVTVTAPEPENAKAAAETKTQQPSASKSLNERFTKTTVELGEKLHAHSGRHLKDLFSLSDKFMFASELFRNDQKHFEEVLKKLNDFESWDEAIRYIEEELHKNFNWDKKQSIAEQFQQIIRKRFNV